MPTLAEGRDQKDVATPPLPPTSTPRTFNTTLYSSPLPASTRSPLDFFTRDPNLRSEVLAVEMDTMAWLPATPLNLEGTRCAE